jgi:hypothetical protein
MLFNKLCPPALLYLIFSITQIAIDSMKGLYNTALIKVWVTFIFTILLNYLCESGLGIVSWIIVFIPFILMTLIVAILLVMFGLDPTTGQLKRKSADDHNPNKPDPNHHPHKHRHGSGSGHHHHEHQEDDKEESKKKIDRPPDGEDHKIYKFLDPRQQEILDRIHRYTNRRIKIPGVNEAAVDHKRRKYSPELGSDYDMGNPISDGKRSDMNGIFYILSNMNESHEAAYFLNQGDVCLQEKSERDINKCIRKLIQRTVAKLGPDKGPVFFQRVKNKYPEYVE